MKIILPDSKITTTPSKTAANDVRAICASGEHAHDDIIICQMSAAERIQSLLSKNVAPSLFTDVDIAEFEGIHQITILADFEIACSSQFCRFATHLAGTSQVSMAIFTTPLTDPSVGQLDVENAIRSACTLPHKPDFSDVAKMILEPAIPKHNASAREPIIELLSDVDELVASGLKKMLAKATGATVSAVNKIVRAARRRPVITQGNGLIDIGGMLVRVVQGERIEVVMPGEFTERTQLIAGFSAQIDRQITYRTADGTDKRIEYIVSGANSHGPLPPVRVTAEDFGSNTWLTKSWGFKAYLPPQTPVTREILRATISITSQDCPESLVYSTCGWHKIDGQPVYLHASGGISKTPTRDLMVEPPDQLKPMDLPRTAKSGRRKAVETFLTIAPHRISSPLLAAVFRAPLMVFEEFVDNLFLVGKTGSGKTSVLGVMMQFFGQGFSKDEGDAIIPGSFRSTSNNLHELAHAAGGMIFGVDDAAPQPGRRANEAISLQVENLGRAHSNRSIRGRLNKMLQFQPSNAPRGLLAITAEEFYVSALSLRNRFFRVPFGVDDVDMPALSAIQHMGNEGDLAAVMADFITWILETGKYEATNRLALPGMRRGGKMAGTLIWASRNIGKWLLDRGEMNDQEREAFCAMMKDGITEAAQISYFSDFEDEADAFLSHLRAAISGGRGKISNWKLSSFGVEDTSAAQCPIVVYIDEAANCAYVSRDASIRVVREWTNGTPNYIAPAANEIGQRFDERGYLLRTEKDTARETLYIRKTFNGVQQKVWVMNTETVLGPGTPQLSQEEMMRDPLITTALRIFTPSAAA